VALWRLQQDQRFDVVGLLTTLTSGYDRISMQGVRRVLLEAQAKTLGLKVYPVWIPPRCSNEAYETEMSHAVETLQGEGVGAVAFGDVFLEDVRAYREKMLAPTEFQPLFPNWGEDTSALSRWVIASGFRATLTCVDPRALSPNFAGRAYDEALLAEMPASVDPCGENGEFHTFVHQAPNFRRAIPITVGERVERDGFFFADLLPAARVSHTG
jgi:diphthamide synthase (EF-2-diphthine--ammonia ligase)